LQNYDEGSTMRDDHPRVFISYAREDVAYVGAVADELRLHGVDSWFDETRPTIRASWHDKTAAAVAAPEVVIIFMGAHIQSPWMNFEIGVAFGGDKFVVPVYLDQTAPGRAPSLLSQFDSIDAHARMPREVADQIADAIRTAA
jgi:hypothetical protein